MEHLPTIQQALGDIPALTVTIVLLLMLVTVIIGRLRGSSGTAPYSTYCSKLLEALDPKNVREWTRTRVEERDDYDPFSGDYYAHLLKHSSGLYFYGFERASPPDVGVIRPSPYCLYMDDFKSDLIGRLPRNERKAIRKAMQALATEYHRVAHLDLEAKVMKKLEEAKKPKTIIPTDLGI